MKKWTLKFLKKKKLFSLSEVNDISTTVSVQDNKTLKYKQGKL